MPDLTLEYFEYLRPTFSLKSLLGLLIIKEEKGTFESKESSKAARLLFKTGESWADKPCQLLCNHHPLRSTWGWGAASPGPSAVLAANLSSCAHSFLSALHDSFMGITAPF